jgi:hypothetical protein
VLTAMLSRAADAVDGGRLLAVTVVLTIAWLLVSARRGHACRGLHCGGCSRG